MTLRRALTPQLQVQRHGRQQTTRDSLIVAQPCRKGPDAVIASCAEDESAEVIVITNLHVETAVRFAQTTFAVLTERRPRAWQGLHA